VTTSTRIPPPPSARRRAFTFGGVLAAAATLGLMLAALAVRGGALFGLVVLGAVLIPMERLFALRPQKVFRAGWRTDVVHFVVNNVLGAIGLVVVVVAAARGVRGAVPYGVRHAIASMPRGWQFLVAVAMTELCFYWAHRATHRVAFLWRFHKVHHSIRELDWLASAHQHPVDQVFTRSCVVLPLYALGFSKATFGAYLVFATFQAIFIHANVRFRFGPLRYVVGTPMFHHWHHAGEPAAYDTNFGGLPITDKLFGTLHLPDAWPDRYGIDEPAPDTYLAQLAWPFRS